MRACLHFSWGFFVWFILIYFNLEGRKQEFLLLLIAPAFDMNAGICTKRELLQSLSDYFLMK